MSEEEEQEVECLSKKPEQSPNKKESHSSFSPISRSCILRTAWGNKATSIDLLFTVDDYDVYMKKKDKSEKKSHWITAFQVFARQFDELKQWKTANEKYKDLVSKWDELPVSMKALYQTMDVNVNKQNFNLK